jgi:hypothetical protein
VNRRANAGEACADDEYVCVCLCHERTIAREFTRDNT